MSVRTAQKNALLQMLNFNEPTEGGIQGKDSFVSSGSQQFKVLVYDNYCRDIISPLLNVQELRDAGVTLHMEIKKPREQISDVPAIYFIEPTNENVERVARDCGSGLYHTFYLNFVSPLSRPQIERLAQLTLQTKSAHRIAKIFDQHLSFISLEPNLVTLNMTQSFLSYNSPSLEERQVMQIMGKIASGIFASIVTMGNVPVIRCPRGGPAECVAKKLETMLRADLSSENSLFSTDIYNNSSGHDQPIFGSQRPVLLILDRGDDMSAPLRHCSTYQALLDDLLKQRLNRVTVPPKEGSGKPKMYHLDVEADLFWGAHAGSAFPEAIEANDEQLKTLSAKEAEVRKSTVAGDAGGGISGDAGGLASAVESLPELMAQKQTLEQHTHILGSLLQCIMKREIPTFCKEEEAAIKTSRIDSKKLTQFMNGPSAIGSIRDRLRLLAVCSLTTDVDDDVLAKAEKALLMSVAADDDAVAAPGEKVGNADELGTIRRVCFYLRQKRQHEMMASGGSNTGSADREKGGNSIGGWFMSQANNMTGGHASNYLAKAAAAAKTYLPGQKTLRCVRLLDACCQAPVRKMNGGTVDPEIQDFLELDPRLSVSGTQHTSGGPAYGTAILFVLGGGTFLEYQSVMAYAGNPQAIIGSSMGMGGVIVGAKKRPMSRKIVYGATEMVNADNFLGQLAKLGS